MRTTFRTMQSVLLVATFSCAYLSADQSGGDYVNRITPAGGASRLASPSFETTAVASQGSPAGAASPCNAGIVISFGFWSATGELPVPITLRVQADASGPGTVDLFWTGVAPQFQVCRAFQAGPQDICAVAYALSFVCQFSDTRSSDSDLVFYRITRAP